LATQHAQRQEVKLSEVNNINEEKGKPIVFVDMDGVLADFFGAWAKLAGKDHYKDIDDPETKLQLVRDHPTFWIDLPTLSGASKLLGAVKKYAGSYNICSTPLTGDPNSEPQKRLWVKKHLSAFAPNEVFITHNKAAHALQPDGTPNILIDDFGKNIKAWEAAGGIGIKHDNDTVNKSIAKLKSATQTTSDPTPQANVEKK
jgi:5'(3')-deoxyribonucleotidase